MTGSRIPAPGWGEGAAGPDPEEPPDGPAEGATPVTLAAAVALALESNFDVLAATDDLRSAQLGYSTEVAEFFPKVTPRFNRLGEETQWGMELGQRLPWTGGTLEGIANWRTG